MNSMTIICTFKSATSPFENVTIILFCLELPNLERNAKQI